MNLPPEERYYRRMRSPLRVLLLAGAALVALGCDTGGLLIVEGTPEPVLGPPSVDVVSAGNVAKNGKYKLVFTMGQPTPESVAKSPNNRLNGGLPGAVMGP